MKPVITLWTFGFLLVCGCAYADKVNVDWDRQANFGQYRTYSWEQSKNPAQDQLMSRRIMQAVDGQLRAKGLQRVEPTQNHDLSVEYDAGVVQKVSWVPYSSGAGWGWGWGPGPASGWDWNGGWGWWGVWDSYYPVVEDVGTLAVNIVDEHQKQLVWRGVASDALKDNPEKETRKIYELVAKMFKKYPPPPGNYRRHLSRAMNPAPGDGAAGDGVFGSKESGGLYESPADLRGRRDRSSAASGKTTLPST